MSEQIFTSKHPIELDFCITQAHILHIYAFTPINVIYFHFKLTCISFHIPFFMHFISIVIEIGRFCVGGIAK